MSLLIRQIVYTNFPGIGFRTFTSEQVSTEIQQAFIQLVSQHWEVYNPSQSGYRAVYLCQLTPEQNLFGWLYNNRVEEVSIHEPYFICYYLAQPLQAVQLEMIFTCLERGPVGLIDRHNLPNSLDTLVLENCHTYPPAGDGVAVPVNIRKRSYIALKQGELLNLFFSDIEQEMLGWLDAQSDEQQGAQGDRSGNFRSELAQKVDSFHDKNYLAESKTKSAVERWEEAVAVPNHKNAQLLLTAIMAVVALTPIGAVIYGRMHSNTFASNQRQHIPVVNNRVFYKTFADVPNVPQGVFNYGGSTVFAPLRSQGFLDAIAQAHPQFYLRYTEPLNNKPGSSKGIEMLLMGELSVCQSSRPLKDSEYSKAKVRGFGLQQVPMAIDGVAFFTHPGIPVAGLSVHQLQAIFMGKVTNWKQLGGPDLPIKPFSKPAGNSTTLDILFAGLKGAGLGDNVQSVRDITASIRRVAVTPGGIGYGTASEVGGQRTIHLLSIAKKRSNQYISPLTSSGQINTQAFRDGTYPLTRILFVVIRRDGLLDEQAGVAYANLLLSNEGQQLIEKAGFVPIRR